jgi:hypothetical protein
MTDRIELLCLMLSDDVQLHHPGSTYKVDPGKLRSALEVVGLKLSLEGARLDTPRTDAKETKEAVRDLLQRLGIKYKGLRSYVKDFTDLARGSRRFVKVLGFVGPDPKFAIVEAFAADRGFSVTTDWPVSG